MAYPFVPFLLFLLVGRVARLSLFPGWGNTVPPLVAVTVDDHCVVGQRWHGSLPATVRLRKTDLCQLFPLFFVQWCLHASAIRFWLRGFVLPCLEHKTFPSCSVPTSFNVLIYIPRLDGPHRSNRQNSSSGLSETRVLLGCLVRACFRSPTLARCLLAQAK